MGPFGGPPEKGVSHEAEDHQRRHRAARMRKWKDNNYSNHRVVEVIDEYIHNARDRDILREKLVDGVTYDALAGKYDLTYERVRDIVRQGKKTIETFY